ncbi:hypothetical protein [Streptomyces sp. NPDC058579]|uniref:hypothetical protein n=1 Tax=Streptomyces sp. NPDC058579 TaxID=3346548 RepID=UPI003651B968
MTTHTAYEDSRASFLSFWLRVREFAVPPSMIETATARRLSGDWAGACAAARVDVDLDLRSVTRAHGRDLTDRLRRDLRHLAPDLLRWHMPRVAPHGLLRPGLTISLARYAPAEPTAGAEPTARASPVHLVARTPPAWAEGGQRISLALWDGSSDGYSGGSLGQGPVGRHPHPRPGRRFRLDLHRHLWDARRADELRLRSGADAPPAGGAETPVPEGYLCAVDRWPAEARHVLRAEGRSGGPVTVRLDSRRRLTLDVDMDVDVDVDPDLATKAGRDTASAAAPLVLPDAATWMLPDLELLRAGAIEAGRLHPLVASALVPDHMPTGPTGPAEEQAASGPRVVECRGDRHRIALVDGVLAPLDHGPEEVAREELLVALGGTPLPCLRAIDEAHRRPDCLAGVSERLQHGDVAGALAVVEGLLGPGATLRGGPLRDALEAAARRRIAYGMFRSGLDVPPPHRVAPAPRRPRDARTRPRLAH